MFYLGQEVNPSPVYGLGLWRAVPAPLRRYRKQRAALGLAQPPKVAGQLLPPPPWCIRRGANARQRILQQSRDIVFPRDQTQATSLVHLRDWQNLDGGLGYPASRRAAA